MLCTIAFPNLFEKHKIESFRNCDIFMFIKEMRSQKEL